jgi:SAM-dependent methyltransferase
VTTSSSASDKDPESWADPAATYDHVASQYAERFVDELEAKPFDRELLSRFADAVRPTATGALPVCDLGCGPGHIGGYLAELGLPVIGIDLSVGMVAEARRRFPALTFSQGDMLRLTLPDASLSGIACFYALIHIPRAQVPLALAGMRRVLAADGALLLAVHGGEGTLHADAMAGQPADLDATLFSLTELSTLVESAGLHVVEAHQRDPYESEHPTPRLYVWGRRK